MDGTPMTMPAAKNTAKKDVRNDTSTTEVSESNFILSLFYKNDDSKSA